MSGLNKSKHLILKRLIPLFLTIIMMSSSLPINVLAESKIFSETNFSQELIDELQILCGDDYDAEDMLMEMYKAGLVDRYGNPSIESIFDIDGVSMTKEEVIELSADKKDNEPVTIDGIESTWGDIKALIAISELMDDIRAYEEGGFEITPEHEAGLKSLNQYMQTDDFFEAFAAATGSIYVDETLDGRYTINTSTSKEIIERYALDTRLGAYTFPKSKILI